MVLKILVLGQGAREHAIAWRLQQSQHQVFLHPGNAGTRNSGFPNLGEQSLSISEISKAAQEKQIELIVIGPEALLVQNYATLLRQEGFLVVGPGEEGAQLESSKIFAKEFMVRAQVPTAKFLVHSSFDEFKSRLKYGTFPKVLKLDGLAAGKGVVIAKSESEALAFAENIWIHQTFGPLPQRLLEEEFIDGVEISYIGLCDGKIFIPLASSTDYKKVWDHNRGPNTGGMGAISPSPYLTAEVETKIQERIITPILSTLQKEELDFRGVLYIGIMLDKNHSPFVLEFNTRFGDPETQSIMMRVDCDLVPTLIATALGKLEAAEPLQWKPEPAVYAVAATEGYPESPKIGDPIRGLESHFQETMVFFAGVEQGATGLVTAGGRVLGVGALGSNIPAARSKIYQRLQQISWPGIHFRKDIGEFQ
jgi:phosphoribosylamine---glycine ligase